MSSSTPGSTRRRAPERQAPDRALDRERPADRWASPYLVFTRPPARQLEREPLSAAKIVQAAVELADTDGLQAASMRRIAGRLGSGTTSLYWHVKSKAELYELMFDWYMAERPLPPAHASNWRRVLRDMAIEARSAMQRHPWVPLLGIQLGLGPAGLRYYARATAVLGACGIEPDAVVRILAAQVNYVIGFAHNELARDESGALIGRKDEVLQRLDDYILRVLGAPDPGLTDLLGRRLQLTGDQTFLFGLDSLLDGIASRFPQLT